MKPDLSSALDECLLRLHRGETLEECLKHYPQLADELLPLLRTARHLQAVPMIQPRPNAIESGRKRMLARAQLDATPMGKEIIGMKLALKLTVSLLVFILLGSIFFINVSASSLPGDLLYGVKRGWEEIRLEFTINDQSHQALKTRFNQRRHDEIQKMVRNGIAGTLTIEGILENEDGDTWTVSGLQVIAGPRTIIEGTKAIGGWLTMDIQVQRDGRVFVLKASFSTGATTIPTLEETETSEGSPGTATPKNAIAPTVIQEPTSTPVPSEDEDPFEDDDPSEEMESTEERESTEEGEPTEADEQTPEVEPTDELDP